jgi:hypothetical protein
MLASLFSPTPALGNRFLVRVPWFVLARLVRKGFIISGDSCTMIDVWPLKICLSAVQYAQIWHQSRLVYNERTSICRAWSGFFDRENYVI